MSEIKNIIDHESYGYYNSAIDDVYVKIRALLEEYQEQELINEMDAVGVLELIKFHIMLDGTEMGEE